MNTIIETIALDPNVSFAVAAFDAIGETYAAALAAATAEVTAKGWSPDAIEAEWEKADNDVQLEEIEMLEMEAQASAGVDVVRALLDDAGKVVCDATRSQLRRSSKLLRFGGFKPGDIGRIKSYDLMSYARKIIAAAA